jgi:hypothetical protein
MLHNEIGFTNWFTVSVREGSTILRSGTTQEEWLKTENDQVLLQLDWYAETNILVCVCVCVFVCEEGWHRKTAEVKRIKEKKVKKRKKQNGGKLERMNWKGRW